MKETMMTWREKLKGFFAKLSKKTRILLSVGIVGLVAGAIIIALVLNNRPYSVLFTGLTGEEVRTIATYLEESGITDYRVQNNDTILVQKNQEQQLKAKLVMEGYPKSGFAYETYRSAVGAMSTQADRNIAYMQDLQDRIAGVIRCMDGVKDAVVMIAQGEDRRYILSTDNMVEASASVMVTMQGGTKLSEKVAAAIRVLLARAVQGLEIDNVEISDSQGNVYGSGDMATGLASASQLKLQLEEQVNNSIRTQIMAILSPIYGEENVRIGVNSTVDVSRTIGEATIYTEPSWAANGETGGQGIIGSKIYDQEVIRGGEAGVGGIVGTGTNSEINNYIEGGIPADGDSNYIKNSGEVNYNVNTEKTQVERLAGTVTDLMVAVSINATTAGEVNANQIVTHVGRAAGIAATQQGEKISILVTPFYSSTPGVTPIIPAPALPQWAIYAAGAGMVLMLLIMLLMAKSRKKRNKQARDLDAMMDGAVLVGAGAGHAPNVGADIMNLRTERSMELRRDIRQFAEDNPEIAAQMVRTWLKGGEEKDG